MTMECDLFPSVIGVHRRVLERNFYVLLKKYFHSRKARKSSTPGPSRCFRNRGQRAGALADMCHTLAVRVCRQNQRSPWTKASQEVRGRKGFKPPNSQAGCPLLHHEKRITLF